MKRDRDSGVVKFEEDEDVHTGPSLRPQLRTFQLVDDVVVKVTGPAEAAVYNISIVSLLAPKTDKEDKLGYPSNQFDLDMATSPRIIPRQDR